MKKIMAFLKDENGQTSTEYILLVAVVAFIIFKFKDILKDKLLGLAGTVFDNAGQLANQINSN
jgi:pilus assembly protein Flp/PilA